MRTGKYEASHRGSSAGTAVTFLLIGLGAGALGMRALKSVLPP